MGERAPEQADREEADEAALLAALRSGAGNGYEELVRCYCARLLAVARRILGNDDDALEATQEAFLAAYRGIRGFDGKARLATWLHRITVNAALMKLRGRRRKPETSLDDLLPRFAADGHHAVPPVRWREPAEGPLERRETQELVRACIGRLPESYRTVLLLRDIEELSTEETSRLLGVSEALVKTRLHRARLALRTLLDPHFRGGAA